MKQLPFLARLRSRFPAKQRTKTPKKLKVRLSSTRVHATSRDHAHELGVLWWRWRHHFLEAKRIELEGQPDA